MDFVCIVPYLSFILDERQSISKRLGRIVDRYTYRTVPYSTTKLYGDPANTIWWSGSHTKKDDGTSSRMRQLLGDKINEDRAQEQTRSHPVCIQAEVSIRC